jgi:hypothetical protein
VFTGSVGNNAYVNEACETKSVLSGEVRNAGNLYTPSGPKLTSLTKKSTTKSQQDSSEIRVSVLRIN